MSTFYGGPALGYKTSSTQQPGLLGDEYDTVVVERDSVNGIDSVQNNGRVTVKWLRNTSASPLLPGAIVKRDTAGDMAHDCVVAAADNPGCAVVDPYLASSVAAGEKFLGIIRGEIDVLSGAAATKGATLKANAAGKSITNPLADTDDLAAAFGVLMETAGGADVLVKAYVDFRALK